MIRAHAKKSESEPVAGYQVTEIRSDLLLASAGAELRFRNRVSVGAQFDGEFAERTTKYSGKGVVRYSW